MSATSIPTGLESQLAALRAIFAGSEVISLPDGTSLVTVPHVALPAGWNQTATSVAFIVPIGFPMARPDCFWADLGLRLASGATPMNTGLNPIPHLGEVRMWFSWHLQHWNPVSDTLLTYMRVIQERFLRAN